MLKILVVSLRILMELQLFIFLGIDLTVPSLILVILKINLA